MTEALSKLSFNILFIKHFILAIFQYTPKYTPNLHKSKF